MSDSIPNSVWFYSPDDHQWTNNADRIIIEHDELIKYLRQNRLEDLIRSKIQERYGNLSIFPLMVDNFLKGLCNHLAWTLERTSNQQRLGIMYYHHQIMEMEESINKVQKVKSS